VFGYGDAKIRDGSHGGQSSKIKYSHTDVRFTTSKDGRTIYVILLGQPESGSALNIKHLAENSDIPDIDGVTILGDIQTCKWSVEDGVLQITAPKSGDFNAITTVFKVQLK